MIPPTPGRTMLPPELTLMGHPARWLIEGRSYYVIDLVTGIGYTNQRTGSAGWAPMLIHATRRDGAIYNITFKGDTDRVTVQSAADHARYGDPLVYLPRAPKKAGIRELGDTAIEDAGEDREEDDCSGLYMVRASGRDYRFAKDGVSPINSHSDAREYAMEIARVGGTAATIWRATETCRPSEIEWIAHGVTS